jgi:hypothetical protein
MRLTILTGIALVATGLNFATTDTASAAKKDPDPKVICWEVEGGTVDIECDKLSDVQADCKQHDPNNKSDLCQKVNRAKIQLPSVQIQQPRQRQYTTKQRRAKRFNRTTQTRKLRARTQTFKRRARR